MNHIVHKQQQAKGKQLTGSGRGGSELPSGMSVCLLACLHIIIIICHCIVILLCQAPLYCRCPPSYSESHLPRNILQAESEYAMLESSFLFPFFCSSCPEWLIPKNIQQPQPTLHTSLTPSRRRAKWLYVCGHAFLGPTCPRLHSTLALGWGSRMSEQEYVFGILPIQNDDNGNED